MRFVVDFGLLIVILSATAIYLLRRYIQQGKPPVQRTRVSTDEIQKLYSESHIDEEALERLIERELKRK